MRSIISLRDTVVPTISAARGTVWYTKLPRRRGFPNVYGKPCLLLHPPANKSHGEQYAERTCALLP